MAEFSKLNGYDIKDKKAIRSYDTVASMKSDETIKVGQHIKTRGYYEINDGGQGEYIVVDDEALVEDGGSIHELTNGLKAKLIIDEKVNILNFGYTLEDVGYDGRTSNIKNITKNLKNAISYLIKSETAKGTDGGKRGIQIYFPDDFYYIDETIDLNTEEISLLGDSPAMKSVVYRLGNFRQKILTKVDGAVFSNGQIHFRGLNFENILTTNTNVTTFSSARINSMTYCHADNYECVTNNVGGVCTIDTNYFLNCRKYFINGSTSDSIIINNYINAAPECKDTILINGSMGMTVIANNYIDFFKTGITNTISTGVRIVNNTFDYIHAPFVIGGVDGVTISNNSFNHISKRYANMLYYANDSSEATTDWIAIDLKYTLNGLTVVGNTINNTDKFINMPYTNASTNVVLDNNILDSNSHYGTFTISQTARNSYKIKIYDLDDRTYETAPTIYNTYTNQVVHYDGATYKNIGNKIVNVGIDALNLGIEKNYTTAGEGNTTIDMTALPSGGLTSCFVLEIRTTKGYNNPSLAHYNVIRIGNNLVIKELFNDSGSDYKTNVTSSGLTLTVSFTGTYEEGTSSKQILIRTFEQ